MAQSSGSNWNAYNETYTPYAQQNIMSALGRAENVSNLPFQPYLGQTVAGFSPSQLAAMQGIYGIQGYYEPYGQAATGDRKSTRLNSGHVSESRMPSSA